MIASILVVDDDAAIRAVVAEALRRDGHLVQTVATLAECDRALALARPDVLVSDVVLPDGDGLDHLAALGSDAPPTIVLSARNTLTTAVRATEAGAFEYLPKPFDLVDLSNTVRAALKDRGPATLPPIDEADAAEDRALPLIGRSPAMQEVYRLIARVVGNHLTVLISGESGTGKELVARAIHDFGPRAAAPFVALNMAAIPRDLIEAELFGHERGAFTGATQRNAGRFEQAAGGTLFLDEIGDMPLEAQTRLLRVLQSGEFTSVGAKPTRTEVRIVAATNRDPAALVAAGSFREDLFYRLNVVPIALPALRERRQDVALLARHFLDRAVADGLPARQLTPDGETALAAYDWPGNVRELENAMRRLAALGRDARIDAAAVAGLLARAPAALRPPSLAEAVRERLDVLAREEPGVLDDGTLYDRIVGEATEPLIAALLARHGGNQLRAARALGINRNTLRKRLSEFAAGRSDI